MPSFFANLGVCRVVSLPLSRSSLSGGLSFGQRCVHFEANWTQLCPTWGSPLTLVTGVTAAAPPYPKPCHVNPGHGLIHPPVLQCMKVSALLIFSGIAPHFAPQRVRRVGWDVSLIVFLAIRAGASAGHCAPAASPTRRVSARHCSGSFAPLGWDGGISFHQNPPFPPHSCQLELSPEEARRGATFIPEVGGF